MGTRRSPESDDQVLRAVERHLHDVFGPDTGRAAVTFLGANQVEVLRFGPDPGGIVRYVTLGMSRAPMDDPTAALRDPAAPRGEFVLSLRGRRDSVARRLAVLAAMPAIEGIPVIAGAGLDLGEPLWDGARFTGVLVAEPSGLVDDLPLEPAEGNTPAPVRFLPVLPMTPNEAAYKRVHGAVPLRQRWLAAGTDLRDPERGEPPLS
jgi:hypothetical protein